MQSIKRILMASAVALFSCSALAGGIIEHDYHHTPLSPWMTGPLLAPSGHTLPQGYLNFEPYVFYTDDFGIYGSRWKKESTLKTTTVNPQMVITYGLSPRFDVQVSIPYLFNSKDGASDNGFGDASVGFGFQALSDVLHTCIPDLKLVIKLSFPTGQYENLNPALKGTDSEGAGAYQTSLSATFQKLFYLANDHFLRGRWNLTYSFPGWISLRGFNAYGGAANTNGRMRPGDFFSTDLAFEYTLTQHWVPAIDFLFTTSEQNTFNGFAGTAANGLPAPITTSGSEEFSIAPAIEYNFNARVGLIAGVWFTVAGRNDSDFVSGVIAINVLV